LVKLLTLDPGHRLHREQAQDILWPDSNRKAASNNLRQALHAARRALDPTAGSRYLVSGDESLVLCPRSDLWVDVDAFEQAGATHFRGVLKKLVLHSRSELTAWVSERRLSRLYAN